MTKSEALALEPYLLIRFLKSLPESRFLISDQPAGFKTCRDGNKHEQIYLNRLCQTLGLEEGHKSFIDLAFILGTLIRPYNLYKCLEISHTYKDKNVFREVQ